MWNKLIDFVSYNATDPIQFNSPIFLIFLTVALVGYPLVFKKVKLRTTYLLLFSLFFFYKTSGVFLLLLLGTAYVNFIIGSLIHKHRAEAKGFLILSIIWNLGTLSFFKYTNYLIAGFNSVCGAEVNLLNIVFPAGISFFTFQTMSYTIDIYRKKLKPVKSFLDFAFFVSFFPQLVAGPIVRASYFLPQINKKKSVTQLEVTSSIMRIFNGLFKKVIIADFLALNYIQSVFSNPTGFSGTANLIAVYAYAIKIYCDFSAYSDMAIGIAKLFGFDLPENFNLPYKASSVKDFWNRWHISLSTWLRDYLYIPLGGNRRGNTYLNLMITMVLGGLWHVRPNAFWTYIVWGSLHGLALIIHRMWSQTKLSELLNTNFLLKLFYKPFAWLMTFNFVCLTWVFFRANSIQSAWEMLSAIFTNIQVNQLLGWSQEFTVIGIFLAVAYLFHFLPTRWDNLIVKPFSKLGIVGTALLVSFILISLAEFKRIEPYIHQQLSTEVEEADSAPKYKVQQFEYYKF